MGQTVNLLSFDFGGSNPSLPTHTGYTPLICHYAVRQVYDDLKRCLFCVITLSRMDNPAFLFYLVYNDAFDGCMLLCLSTKNVNFGHGCNFFGRHTFNVK